MRSINGVDIFDGDTPMIEYTDGPCSLAVPTQTVVCSNEQIESPLAHPNTSGGTFANKLTVDADLSEASLEDATIALMGFQDDRGLLINVMPKSLHIARQEIYNAGRILKSTNQPTNGNNDLNILRANNVFPGGAVVNHYFTSPHAWFIRTNVRDGMKYYERVGVQFDQDNDFDTMNAKAKGYERYSFGWTDPRAIFGSNGP